MINISNCPVTGLNRRVAYDFYWLSSTRKIVIMCTVSYHSTNGDIVKRGGINTYQQPLTASDSLIRVDTQQLLTAQQTADYKALAALHSSYASRLAMYETQLAEYESVPIEVRDPRLEPTPPVQPAPLPYQAIEEYDFYVNVIGVTKIILPQLIENIIAARDLEGKFN